MTYCMIGLLAIAAIGGIVVTIVNPSTLSFPQYLDDMKTFAVAVGVLGIGRGIVAGQKHRARARDPELGE